MFGELRTEFSRRFFLGSSAFAGLAGPAVALDLTGKTTSPNIRGDLFVLTPRPTRVFKIADRSHENTESWVFSLIVQSTAAAAITPAKMTIDLLKGGTVLRSTDYPAEGFAPLTFRIGIPPRLPDGSIPAAPIFWPFIIRLRQTEPIALGVDAMRIVVEATDSAGQRGAAAIVIPIETYEQKTALVFPFRGKGLIFQAGTANGGHRNRSGEFALDAMGLDDAWSMCAPGDGKKNADYPGWGRTLVAPADGTIVHARNDRPDQPVADESDPTYYAPEYQQRGGGDPGNHVIIDHASGEFSMIAHFMAGSMLVKSGDRVHQGQTLGKLGHSGDANGPHVHYQLQAGPDWENSDALPCKFSNVAEQFLDRGTYFEAK